jgi:hypothetical protein
MTPQAGRSSLAASNDIATRGPDFSRRIHRRVTGPKERVAQAGGIDGGIYGVSACVLRRNQYRLNSLARSIQFPAPPLETNQRRPATGRR